MAVKESVAEPSMVSVAECVMESHFSFKLWWSLFLAKLQAFLINGNEVCCDGVCF